MKTLLFACLIALASFGFTANLNVTVDNQSNYALGTVTLYYSGGQTSVSISGTGTYGTTVGSSVTAISISGQKVFRPSTGPVVLSNGAKLDIQWVSDNLIEIVEETVIQAPVRH